MLTAAEKAAIIADLGTLYQHTGVISRPSHVAGTATYGEPSRVLTIAGTISCNLQRYSVGAVYQRSNYTADSIVDERSYILTAPPTSDFRVDDFITVESKLYQVLSIDQAEIVAKHARVELIDSI